MGSEIPTELTASAVGSLDGDQTIPNREHHSLSSG